MKRKLRKISALLSLPPKSKAEKRWNFLTFFSFSISFGKPMQVGLNDWPWLAATLLPFSLMRGRPEWYFYSALFFFCSVFLAVHLFFSKSKSSHFCIFRASRLTSLRRLYLSGRSRGYLYGGWRKKRISPLLCSKQEIEFHGQNHPLPLRMKGEKMRQRRRRPKRKKKIFMSASAEASEEKTFFLLRGRKDVNSQLTSPSKTEAERNSFYSTFAVISIFLLLKALKAWRIPDSISATLCSEEEQMTLLPLGLLLRCKLRLLPLRPFSSPPFLFLPFWLQERTLPTNQFQQTSIFCRSVSPPRAKRLRPTIIPLLLTRFETGRGGRRGKKRLFLQSPSLRPY